MTVPVKDKKKISKKPEEFHEPVLLDEVVKWLVITPSGLYVDCTVGGGGHAEAILEVLAPEGRLLGIDRDEEALAFSAQRLERFHDRVKLKKGNFAELQRLLAEEGIAQAQGILLDLGVSSHQIDSPERGFSYLSAGPLDMRMDRSQSLTAAEVVNTYEEKALTRLLRQYGEETFAQRIAGAICRERERQPLQDTQRLASIVRSAVPQRFQTKSLARVFQALRIEVNQELEALRTFLENSLSLVCVGGRIVTIAYHSLEDRLVKHYYRREERACVCPPDFPFCVCGKKGRARVLTKKGIRATEAETDRNPRSRSATLRVVERTA